MSNMVFGEDEVVSKNLPPNLIRTVFTDEQLILLTRHMLRVDIPDNNDKAEMVKMFVPKGFQELGTGTNRIAFLHNNLVYKIALDRRGMVDNCTEFRRSAELPMYLAKTYESNLLINIAEYVTVIDQHQFSINGDTIRAVLEDIAKGYLFDDVGYAQKNYCNWGSRLNPDGSADIVILDYGYLYPLMGENTTRLFSCPKCGGRLKWNNNYTEFQCQNVGAGKSCGARISPTIIRNRMGQNFEKAELEMLQNIESMKMPDFNRIEQATN
ncbi:MAG: hypothetical protein NC548_06415 [Lachnospiraceae bacterium]|nr:hypothetical protein [Lachnospiraceae bacterium]